MKLWLLWHGSYSDASVVGVYSSQELAEQAQALTPYSYIDDAHELDAKSDVIKSGKQRWSTTMVKDTGDVITIRPMGLATGEAPLTIYYESASWSYPQHPGGTLVVESDALNQETAVKIAGDERARFIAEQNGWQGTAGIPENIEVKP